MSQIKDFRLEALQLIRDLAIRHEGNLVECKLTWDILELNQSMGRVRDYPVPLYHAKYLWT